MLTLLSLPLFGQQIEYKLAEDIEGVLYKRLHDIYEDDVDNVYAYLSHNGSGMYYIFLSYRSKGGIIRELTDLTDRVLRIREYTVPLVFDADLTFCSAHRVSETDTDFGNRDGQIKKVTIIYEGEIFYFSVL